MAPLPMSRPPLLRKVTGVGQNIGSKRPGGTLPERPVSEAYLTFS